MLAQPSSAAPAPPRVLLVGGDGGLADAKLAQMAIQLPLGLNLTEAIQIKVDSGPTESQAIQTCTNVGCFVSMTLNDKFLASMRSGKDLKIIVQDANKKPLELSLPLLGFGLAYDKVK